MGVCRSDGDTTIKVRIIQVCDLAGYYIRASGKRSLRDRSVG